MQSLGKIIRKSREDRKLPLRIVAHYLDIDQAILSKIERGQRKISRAQVLKLAKYFKVNEEELLVAWLSDKMEHEMENDDLVLKALHVAEERVEYKIFKKIDRKKLLAQIKKSLSQFPQVQKAWIYGSFAREDDGPKSDIDIAVKTTKNFSYFDLADIKEKLERSVNRKVDVGFIDSFKSHVLENVKPDLKLIYEK
jgi:predicted nucleotidyltransferase/plasmid maintenance system antidote protein VapI